MLFPTHPSNEEYDAVSVQSSIKTEWIRQAIPILTKLLWNHLDVGLSVEEISKLQELKEYAEQKWKITADIKFEDMVE